MNLFWKRLLGGITPTAKLEKQEAELVAAMKRYAEVEKSVELAEYKTLFHIVKSAEFIKNREILKNRKYKDTQECRSFKKFQKYSRSIAIQHYYKVLHTDELKHFLVFKDTAQFEELGDKKLVKASSHLQKMKKYQHSKDFKIYSRFHESFAINEFEELKKLISTPEFTKANEFWSNAKRWHLTPEFEKEQRFYELAKNPDIVFYENEKPERFEKYRELKAVFMEEFDWNTLDKSHWDFGFHYTSEQLMANHSFADEKQANHHGRNVAVENGVLRLSTRQETVKAPAWHPKKGFIEKEFHYTSDVLQTSKNFRQKYGVIRAKLRCTGHIHHAFWLSGENKLPFINIFHYDGKQICVGNSAKEVVDGVKISGINPAEFFIYTLVWTDKELYWMINDLEIYRTVSQVPAEELYLGFNSFIKESQHGTTGHLEVDWVRTYSFSN